MRMPQSKYAKSYIGFSLMDYTMIKEKKRKEKKRELDVQYSRLFIFGSSSSDIYFLKPKCSLA